MTMIKEQYVSIIKEFDKTLDLLRRKYFGANLRDKSDWMGSIDSALDERLRLMSLRDKK